ncbi:quinone-dependent dihydroorotate dehydrogenase [Corynebacterium heidelbergense]|uniref:Dihydroorotate dehydrogenase (quinone) n=1 Tax=Corynebacterium heidelbergense TaxID=2055947 RepID=A0A364VAU5_9CORY|nr:quinone-dependent dihydroorotate dehydrogenase [Corynebacterium heidelbergense]RAV33783.1 dihydroorotate dehydrogenase (quinone) [Corynebacterium heidelbergense]WCZ36539.1 Dihydroorotate dehydrogenase (quinone) [Corynebacterium heidelbergense]
MSTPQPATTGAPRTRGFRRSAYNAALHAMFRLPPERIHHYMTRALTGLSASPAICTALRRLTAIDEPGLAQDIAGLHFPRPLGLAAGFDKDATEVDAWGALGFGYAEVGTLTSLAQPGNPTPRLFRLPKDRAILNRMGFNNFGVDGAARRLSARRCPEPVGVNLGKSKITPAQLAPGDYRMSARAVEAVADYLVINVSSPNTPGLRDLQAVDSLRAIVAAVRKESSRPLFVKIAPDLSDEDVLAITDAACEMQLTGIIATNTTIGREGLAADASYVRALGAGGISGAPLARRAQQVLELVADRARGRLVLIAVGGIETPQQAWERIAAGAHLLQGYTGLIYGGPDWIRDIHLGLAQQLRRQGLTHLSQAVGCRREWID